MQRKVLASAVALGLSVSLATVPAADAAQIGTKDELGRCSVRLTDAEQRYFDQRGREFNLAMLAEAGVAAAEAVYPDFRKPAERLVNSPEVKNAVREMEKGNDPTEEQLDKIEALFSGEENRFGDVSKQEIYLGYLEAKLLAENPALQKQLGGEDLVGDFFFTEVEASREAISAPDFAGLIIDEFGFTGAKAAQVREAFAETPFGQKWPAFANEYSRAMTDAQTACADGGKRDVKFPTAKTTNTDQTTPDQTTPDQTKPGDKAGDKAKDNGSSEDTGKIIGIITGVLVALGLVIGGVVAFAPQLGITLPF